MERSLRGLSFIKFKIMIYLGWEVRAIEPLHLFIRAAARYLDQISSAFRFVARRLRLMGALSSMASWVHLTSQTVSHPVTAPSYMHHGGYRRAGWRRPLRRLKGLCTIQLHCPDGVIHRTVPNTSRLSQFVSDVYCLSLLLYRLKLFELTLVEVSAIRSFNVKSGAS
jgi:hypothetical protein